jgi:hypothetical protein
LGLGLILSREEEEKERKWGGRRRRAGLSWEREEFGCIRWRLMGKRAGMFWNFNVCFNLLLYSL